jgi:hypothetical protein
MSGVTSLKECQSSGYRFIMEKTKALRIDALDVELRAGESQEIIESRPSRDRCILRHSINCHGRHDNGVVQLPL